MTNLSKSKQFARPRTTGSEATGILAFFATLPRGQRRAKFTMPRQESRKGRYAFDGRSSSVDFLPMTLRTRFLITALFLCHQLLASALVTSQLPSENSGRSESLLHAGGRQKRTLGGPAARPARCRPQPKSPDSTTICADQQEKVGNVYKLHGNAEIHYRNYVLRADEITYNSDSGEATASGHFTLDGGPNDDHIKASHGNYNLTAETGRFYDVTATTGLRFRGSRAVLTSTAPFAFSGKMVEKTSPDHYLVYDGTITTCELPHPKWQFEAHKVVVDVGGNASIYHSTFLLHGFPVFYFPYATHPVAREARDDRISDPDRRPLLDQRQRWLGTRSTGPSIAAWTPPLGRNIFPSEAGRNAENSARAPATLPTSSLNFFGVIDRGLSQGAGVPPLREGGQEARLTAEGNFSRLPRGLQYRLSEFISVSPGLQRSFHPGGELRSEVAGVSVEGTATAFLSAAWWSAIRTSFRLRTRMARCPIRRRSIPSRSCTLRASTHPAWTGSWAHRLSFWSFDASLAGLSRSEPGFHTAELLGRFDLSPEISLPLQFHGWSLRPALALHETYYTERFVSGVAVNDPTNRQALETSVEVRAPVLEKIFDKELFGRKWKHVIEPRAIYRWVTGVNDFANVLHFDERDILSNTHEVEYGFVTRLYAKASSPAPIEECDVPMTGLAVGAAAPEQIVPWQRVSNLESRRSCSPGPETKRSGYLGSGAEIFPRSQLRRSAGGRAAQRVHHDGSPDRHCVRHPTAASFPSGIANARCHQQPHRHRVGSRLRLSATTASTRARCWSTTTWELSRSAAGMRSCKFRSPRHQRRSYRVKELALRQPARPRSQPASFNNFAWHWVTAALPDGDSARPAVWASMQRRGSCSLPPRKPPTTGTAAA